MTGSTPTTQTEANEQQAAVDHQNAVAAAIRQCDGYQLAQGQAGYAVWREEYGETNYLVDAQDTPDAAWLAAAQVLTGRDTSDGRYQAVMDAFSDAYGELYVDNDHVDWLWGATWPSVETAYANEHPQDALVRECATRIAAAIAVMAYGTDSMQQRAGLLPTPLGG